MPFLSIIKQESEKEKVQFCTCNTLDLLFECGIAHKHVNKFSLEMFESLRFKYLLSISYSIQLKYFYTREDDEDMVDNDGLEGLGVQLNTVPEISEFICS